MEDTIEIHEANVLSLSPEDGMEEMGDYYLHQGCYDKALQYYVQVLAVTSSPAHIQCHIASCFLYLEKFKEAEEAICEAIVLDSENAVYHGIYAIILICSIGRPMWTFIYPGRYRKAKEEAALALALDADDAFTHEVAAQVAAFKLDKKTAEKHFKEALALDPEKSSCFEGLADLYHISDEKKSREYALQALALNPESGDAHKMLGNLDKSRGELESALYHYKMAQSLDPREGETVQKAVRVCERGKKRKPLVCFVKFLLHLFVYLFLFVVLSVVMRYLFLPVVLYCLYDWMKQKGRRQTAESYSKG